MKSLRASRTLQWQSSRPLAEVRVHVPIWVRRAIVWFRTVSPRMRAANKMAVNRRVIVAALLAALGAAAGWLGYRYQHDLERAHARIATGSQIAATACGPIEYAESGHGSAVLVVHGAGGGFDQGLELGRAIAAGGYQVIAMSRFGYLRTPVPPHPSAALQAAAHACLLDALGIDRAAVIGVSAGAPSALEFALRYPSRCAALVLLVPGWYSRAPSSTERMGSMATFVFEQSLRSDLLFWAIGKFFPAIAARVVLGTPPAVVETASRSEQARAAAVLRGILPISRRQAGLSLEAQLTTAPLSEPLESVLVPTLAISVQDDLYGTAENARYIAKRIHGSKLVMYPSGGHMFIGHNRAMIATVNAFLHDNGWMSTSSSTPRSPRSSF